MKSQKILIHNVFFDTLVLALSFLISPVRSIFTFFFGGIDVRKNIFFDFLDFILRKWTKYFWTGPSAYKLFGALGHMFDYLLGSKK